MALKSATYNLVGGGEITIPYDPNAPCRCCGQPVLNASMGGTDLCPTCDLGYRRSPKCPPGSRKRL